MTTRRPAVLVTGAAGLIGSAVVRHLRRLGHPVVACDDLSLGTSRLEGDDIVWEECDVSEPGLSDRLSRHRVDAVVHCAAHPGGRSLEEPSTDVRVNALGSMQVFEWCARTGVPVVYLSSSAVYGEQPPMPIRESAPVYPGTIYAVCKAACEQFLRTLHQGYGLQWTVLRLFATYGAGHRPGTSQGIVNVMLTQLLEQKPVTVRGRLDRVRDLLYVEDAARAVVDCLFDQRTRGRILNVGTGEGVTIRDLINMLCHALGRRVDDVRIIQAEPTVGDPQYSVADISALKEAIEFSPCHALHEGLDRLVRARLSESRG
jgi:UDP-glucose 4-epimerase